MFKGYILLFFLFSFNIANGQNTNFFSFQYGDYTNNIDTTSDGGYITCGVSFGNINGNNFLITKLDKAGNKQWDFQNTQFNGSDSENYLSEVKETLDKGYIGVGSISVKGNPTNIDLLIVKLDSLGNLIWRRNYDIDHSIEALYTTHVKSDSTYTVLGTGLGYYLLANFNKVGDTLWTRKIPVSTITLVEQMLSGENGYYLFGVSYDSIHNTNQEKIVFVDSVGNIKFSTEHPDTAEIWYDFKNVIQTKDSFLLSFNHMKSNSNQYYFQVNKYGSQGTYLGSWIVNTIGVLANDSNIVGYHITPITNPDTFSFGSENFYTNVYQEYDKYLTNGASVYIKKFAVDKHLNCIIVGKHTSSGGAAQAITARFVNSNIFGLKNIPTSKDWWSVYPNPTSSFISISLNSFMDQPNLPFSISLNDMFGKLVFVRNELYSRMFELDVSSFSKGVYALRVFNRKNSQVEKLVIK